MASLKVPTLFPLSPIPYIESTPLTLIALLRTDEVRTRPPVIVTYTLPKQKLDQSLPARRSTGEYPMGH